MSPEIFHTEVLSKSDVITLVDVSLLQFAFAKTTYTTLDGHWLNKTLTAIHKTHSVNAT